MDVNAFSAWMAATALHWDGPAGVVLVLTTYSTVCSTSALALPYEPPAETKNPTTEAIQVFPDSERKWWERPRWGFVWFIYNRLL